MNLWEVEMWAFIHADFWIDRWITCRSIVFNCVVLNSSSSSLHYKCWTIKKKKLFPLIRPRLLPLSIFQTQRYMSYEEDLIFNLQLSEVSGSRVIKLHLPHPLHKPLESLNKPAELHQTTISSTKSALLAFRSSFLLYRVRSRLISSCVHHHHRPLQTEAN